MGDGTTEWAEVMKPSWPAAGGLVRTRSLGEKLIADGWVPEVLSRDEDGRITDSVWWPPHLAKERGLRPSL